MELLRQCSEYSDDEIKVYQGHIENWYQVWMQLHALEGCTNYTHLLSSAHIAEYMFKWRNMYRFSQQGWENFNHVFSTVYFQRTNHGGKKNATAIKSKLVGIGHWLQQRLLWITGFGNDILDNNEISTSIVIRYHCIYLTNNIANINFTQPRFLLTSSLTTPKGNVELYSHLLSPQTHSSDLLIFIYRSYLEQGAIKSNLELIRMA
jgi:hypothetical protein